VPLVTDRLDLKHAAVVGHYGCAVMHAARMISCGSAGSGDDAGDAAARTEMASGPHWLSVCAACDVADSQYLPGHDRAGSLLAALARHAPARSGAPRVVRCATRARPSD